MALPAAGREVRPCPGWSWRVRPAPRPGVEPSSSAWHEQTSPKMRVLSGTLPWILGSLGSAEAPNVLRSRKQCLSNCSGETHSPSGVDSINSIFYREPAGWHNPALCCTTWILSSTPFFSSFQRS